MDVDHDLTSKTTEAVCLLVLVATFIRINHADKKRPFRSYITILGT